MVSPDVSWSLNPYAITAGSKSYLTQGVADGNVSHSSQELSKTTRHRYGVAKDDTLDHLSANALLSSNSHSYCAGNASSIKTILAQFPAPAAQFTVTKVQPDSPFVL
ncbi:unnamed protein product [Diplocarpon coronariae]|uniref:Uncharacterized protein n=1 Tax=Diplocarpon coronariae TaxID=2795749 RepID=A0A218YVR6_9HELO|nr:hypothetical protein B2J93_6812 [Marssonina coronariae]